MRLYTRDELCLLLLFMFLDRSRQDPENELLIVEGLMICHLQIQKGPEVPDVFFS